MRSSRVLLPFASGAISMLLVVIAFEWAAPGLARRIHAAPGAEASSPRSGTEAAAAGTPEAPVVGVPAVGIPAAAAGPAIRPGLLIPVQGVEAASLVDTYEQARSEGRRHNAIDIVAARGTPVLAASDGVVMKLFQSARGGTTLYQMAPDRRTIYYYAHLDHYAPDMAEGLALRRGEVLGYVGDTGDAGPANYHLHFEVTTAVKPGQYWGGTPQNPYALLRQLR